MSVADRDLATQLRIAKHHRRLAMRLGDERVKCFQSAPYWGVALSLAVILLGLSFTMHMVLR